ncbi:MAG: family 16 glycosylhydrolase [Candidatus Marinimicrobia bacterium]|nr:family 16 glycosylhydrolase [Candidatus Neomarinimicrobiota bacterium]
MFLFQIVYGQLYRGAELRTLNSYLYGKFETRCKSARGDGLVSSFFTYNDDHPTTPWNEIDIEILGRYDQVIDLNTITWGTSSHIRQNVVSFDPHADFHTYGFEWTPDYVAWFIDGEEVYRQTGGHIDELYYPQKIMMNLWNPIYDDWVGTWDERILPRFAYYDYVRFASYTPGEGETGTDLNFTFEWQDDFNALDTTLWEKSHNHTWGGNMSLLIEDNIVFQDGQMILCLTNSSETGFVDNTNPSALWCRQSNDVLQIRFSEELDQLSSEDVSNYSLTGTSFINAILQDDQRTVDLLMDSDIVNNTSLGVFNIQDDNDPPNTLPWQVVWLYASEPLGDTIRINNGGIAHSEYLADQVWGPDKEYGHEGGNYQILDETVDIDNTDDDEIYRSTLNRLAAYRIRVEDGIYSLHLRLSENYYDPDERSFDIIIEDSLWVNNLDVCTTAGFQTAYDLVFEPIIVTDGILDLHFSAELYGIGYGAAGPFVNGIELIKQESLGISQIQPNAFHIDPPYPNPFNSTITIPVQIYETGSISVVINNIVGEEIIQWKIDEVEQGYHEISWNGTDKDGLLASSGIYLIRADSNHHQEFSKISLIK